MWIDKQKQTKRPKLNLIKDALAEPDKTLAFLGLLFALILTIWLALNTDAPTSVAVGILSFFACAGYLLLRKNSRLSAAPSLDQTASLRFYMVLNILFFLLLSYSIISLYLRAEPDTRPLSYFISVALMAALLGVEILFLPPRRSCTYLALFKVILISLSLEWSQILLFSSVVGNDAWYHQQFTTTMLEGGHISTGQGYSMLPIMHLEIGATSLMTDLGYKMATMLSVNLLNVVCGTTFIFLIGRLIHSTKAGLLAALLLAVANMNIMFGYWSIPNTLGVTLILIIIYLLFKVKEEHPVSGLFLAVLSMGVLLLTHTISALWLSILLFVFWLAFTIYKRVYEGRSSILRPHQSVHDTIPSVKASTPVRFYLPVLFSMALLGWWKHTGDLRFLQKIARLGFSQDLYIPPVPPVPVPPVPVPPVPVPPVPVPPAQIVADYMQKIPLSEQLFNQMGLFLFFALSFIGVLYLISRRSGNRYGFAIALGGFILLAIAFAGLCTERGIIPGRWIFLSQVLLALPLGITLLLLSGMFKGKMAKASVAVILVFPLSFLMIMSPLPNMDNRTFSENTIVHRAALTESEIQAIDIISTVSDGDIGVDRNPMFLLRFQLGAKYSQIDYSLVTGDFTNCQDMIVMIREEVVQHPFNCFDSVYRLDYDPRQSLEEQGFSCIYNCGSVSAFRWQCN